MISRAITFDLPILPGDILARSFCTNIAIVWNELPPNLTHIPGDFKTSANAEHANCRRTATYKYLTLPNLTYKYYIHEKYAWKLDFLSSCTTINGYSSNPWVPIVSPSASHVVAHLIPKLRPTKEAFFDLRKESSLALANGSPVTNVLSEAPRMYRQQQIVILTFTPEVSKSHERKST